MRSRSREAFGFDDDVWCSESNTTPRRYRTRKKIGNGEQQQRGLFHTGRPALPEPVDNFGPPGRRHVDFASSKKTSRAWTLRHQRRSITWTLRHRWRWSRPRNLPVSLRNRAVHGRCTKICYKDPYKSKWIIRLYGGSKKTAPNRLCGLRGCCLWRAMTDHSRQASAAAAACEILPFRLSLLRVSAVPATSPVVSIFPPTLSRCDESEMPADCV
jgi:hypothetical protein